MDSNDRDLNAAYFKFDCIKKGKQGEKKFKGFLLPKYLLLAKVKYFFKKKLTPIRKASLNLNTNCLLS